ncbi:MAG: chorismate mutase [Chloroflexales bacterium]
MTIWCRGIRGATTCDENSRESILTATHEMLQLMIAANGLRPEDLASAIFTTTPDLNAEFPAVAARELGWIDTALMCGHEMSVPGSLPRCIRVLVHWNTERQASEVIHIYARGASNLRPERAARMSALSPHPLPLSLTGRGEIPHQEESDAPSPAQEGAGG